MPPSICLVAIPSAQRHSLPRHLFHHPRRSRLFSPVQKLNLSTSSAWRASASSKGKSSHSSDSSTASSIRVPIAEAISRLAATPTPHRVRPEAETVLNVDEQAHSAKQTPPSSDAVSSSSATQSNPEQASSSRQTEKPAESEQQQQQQQEQQQQQSSTVSLATSVPVTERTF